MKHTVNVAYSKASWAANTTISRCIASASAVTSSRSSSFRTAVVVQVSVLMQRFFDYLAILLEFLRLRIGTSVLIYDAWLYEGISSMSITSLLDTSGDILTTSMRTAAGVKDVSCQAHLPLNSEEIETLPAVCLASEPTVLYFAFPAHSACIL